MRSLPILVAAAVIGLCPAAPAQPLTFTRIADTSTAIPNGAGNFTGLGYASVSGSLVSFYGSGSGQGGFYAKSTAGGPLIKIVDFNTPIPGGAGNFVIFDIGAGASGTTIVIRGMGDSNQLGIYTASTAGGPGSLVADRNTVIPGGTATFTGMSGASLSGSTAAFSGGNSNTGQRGIYTVPAGGGPLTRVADTTTAIPNGVGNFAGGAEATTISGSTVVFGGSGSGGQQGLYAGPISGGPLTRVADTHSAVPNSTGAFTSFGGIDVSGSTVAFVGVSATQQGVYIGSTGGGTLTRVADLNTPIPGGTGNFSSWTVSGNSVAVAVSGSTVAFQGSGSGGQTGIYAATVDGDALTKLIAAGDTLDGRTVSGLTFLGDGLDGASLAFQANFTDGTSGIYVGVMPVPEPSSLALAGVTLVGWFVRRRRRASPSPITKSESAPSI